MIALALKLLIGHFMGDFLFQPDHWVKAKQQKGHLSIYIYFHIVVHAILLILLLQFQQRFFVAILFICTSHYITDLIKISLQDKWNHKLLFGLDQGVHLGMIGIVVYYYHPFMVNWDQLLNESVLVLGLSLLLVSTVTGVVMKVIMSSWELPEDSSDHSLKNGGKIIGILERLFVFGFIVLNQWQAIGLLIAAKSVFRFGDLSRAKDRKLTEYILIGTLLSFGIAIAIGLLYKHTLAYT